jgi:hypothetical protein
MKRPAASLHVAVEVACTRTTALATGPVASTTLPVMIPAAGKLPAMGRGDRSKMIALTEQNTPTNVSDLMFMRFLRTHNFYRCQVG